MHAEADRAIWDEVRLADPHGQPDKAKRVQAMFDAIAPTYELVNRVLSMGRDAYWRRRAVEWAAIRPDDEVLDLACGTGDFARAFAAARPRGVVGCDFAEGMLGLAAQRGGDRLRWARADALSLPFPNRSFSVVSCAFGVRNFSSLSTGIKEAARVLKPGGRIVILEFSVPRSRLLGSLYLFYFHRVLPRLAAWISGDRTGAYSYLPQSVTSFVDADGMTRTLESAGFEDIQHRRMTIGIVTVYLARRHG